MEYIYKTLFKYGTNRLPHKLSKAILAKNIFWAEKINKLGENFNISFVSSLSEDEWLRRGTDLLENLKLKRKAEHVEKAKASVGRFYKYLDYSKGCDYLNNNNSIYKMSLIFKARCDLLQLNANEFRNDTNTICTLCNLREDETLFHMMGKCPILKEFRCKYFGKAALNHEELINVLNGDAPGGWENLYKFLSFALKYRNLIINEFT